MSRNQMEFETANGEMITLELSDETRAACNSYFVAAARTLLENYRKVEFEMRTAKHQLEDLKARGEKGTNTTDEVYNKWYDAVYEPQAEAMDTAEPGQTEEQPQG